MKITIRHQGVKDSRLIVTGTDAEGFSMEWEHDRATGRIRGLARTEVLELTDLVCRGLVHESLDRWECDCCCHKSVAVETEGAICEAEGCDGEPKVGGYCDRHNCPHCGDARACPVCLSEAEAKP